MFKRLSFVVTLTCALVGMMVVPGSATSNCVIGPTTRFELSQRVATNTDGVITNIRGLQMDLNVRSPYLHPNAFIGSYNSSLPSWIRQAIRIQTSTSTTSSGSTYIEYGWEYRWNLQPLGQGPNWQRRAYYVSNVNGADPNPHYLGNIGEGAHRFHLYNYPTGTYANKWVLQNKTLSTGATVIHKVLDPPYDAGQAFSLVAANDSCNEMTMQSSYSWRYPGSSGQWLKVGSQNNGAWWYGKDANLSAPETHWMVGGWIGNFEEWFTTCYRQCTRS